MNSNHLTDEQMDVMLSDPKSRIESEHLKVCATCSAECESLLAVMCDLRAAVTASAEQHRRTARLPEPLFRMPRRAFAAFATAAILCIAGPVAAHHRTTRVVGASAPLQQMQADVSDAQLLSDVQQDVSSQIAQPMLPLAANVASNGATTSTYTSNY